MKLECARNVKVFIMINQEEVREMKFEDKYKPHIDKGGGIPKGYRFKICPECGKRGVSSRVIGRKLIRKACRYCGWLER